MKSKNKGLAVVAMLVAGFGFWWLVRLTANNGEKTANALMSAKADTPKRAMQLTIAPPVAPPPASKASAASGANLQGSTEQAETPNADPQAELKTAIPDVARLWREG